MKVKTKILRWTEYSKEKVGQDKNPGDFFKNLFKPQRDRNHNKDKADQSVVLPSPLVSCHFYSKKERPLFSDFKSQLWIKQIDGPKNKYEYWNNLSDQDILHG